METYSKMRAVEEERMASMNEPVSILGRPTAVFEFEGSSGYFLSNDVPNIFQVLVADISMEANIPVGAEIKSIEFMFDEAVGWVDIREMSTIDGVPYVLNVYRTFDGANIYGEGFVCFGIISFINESNYVYDIVQSYGDGKIRITYYTDNIGGENNA